MQKFALMASVAVIATTWAADGRAQTAAAETRLDEVVVTAQRRSENLQNVPIAVVAITGAQAANQGVVSGQTLNQLVPALNFERVPTASTPFLRGVGTPGSTIGNEPSIAFYLDDIYVPNGTASAFDFNNIDAVEVLRGPQGTLFGRNATGGVIQIRTKDPTVEPQLDVSAGYGNYDTRTGQLYASAGVGQVAANIAAFTSDQKNGWGRNITTGHDTFRQYSWGARGKLRWESEGGDTSAMIIGDVQRAKGDIGMPARTRPGTFTRNGYSPDAAGAGFYDGVTNNDSLGKRYYDQLSLKVRQDFDHASLQSVSSYSKTKFQTVFNDVDGGPTPFFLSANYPQVQFAFTQELQLSSAPSSPVKWVMGAYYFQDKSRSDIQASGLAAGAAGSFTIYGQSKTDSYSGYAQATAEIMPRTNLTIGVRYTSDKRDLTGKTRLGATTVGITPLKASWQALTGRFSVDHRVTDDIMAYAAYNRGFKSGVFNIAGLSLLSPVGPAPVNPEDLNAYSVGFKSQFLDNRIRVNAEGFWYDYKNIQVFNVTATGTTLLLNAASATIKGVDIDIQAAPVDGVTLTAAANIQKGRYGRFPGGPGFFPQAPNPQAGIPAGGCLYNGATIRPGSPYPTGAGPTIQLGCDLSGKKTIQTPPFSLSLSADYKVPTSFGVVTATVGFSHRAKFFIEADNNYSSVQPATDLVNASLFWVAPSGDVDVRLWARNLTNEKSYSYLAQGTSGGTRYAPREPRVYGVTVGYHY